MQIDYFQEAQEDEPHQKLVLQLLSLTLLGYTNPRSHCHFQAFSKGLKLKFLCIDWFLQVMQHVQTFSNVLANLHQFVKLDEQIDPPIYDQSQQGH
jgi:hypothetical protein